jgi:hypothetical protein
MGVSVSFHLCYQHSSPFSLCLHLNSISKLWGTLGAVHVLYMCSPAHNLTLSLYSSTLFTETIAAMRHRACTTLGPSTVVRSDDSDVLRTVSRVKHHQEEAEAYIRSSCPGSEGFGRGWELFEDKEGLKHCVPHVKPNL